MLKPATKLQSEINSRLDNARVVNISEVNYMRQPNTKTNMLLSSPHQGMMLMIIICSDSVKWKELYTMQAIMYSCIEMINFTKNK